MKAVKGGFLLLLWLLAACRPSGTIKPAIPTATATPIELSPIVANPAVRGLTIIYTNDEHGWMEGVAPGRGAAEIVSLWQDAGCIDLASCLILSGGDMWTGPAISTWFDGESMVEIMNTMGYAAAAVGNHEFDFGLAQLSTLTAESSFPLLSANLREKTTGQTPVALGIKPYVLLERNGIRIGVIGLTTTSTPTTTDPRNVANFDFLDYETTLREVIPEVQAQGADMIVVPAHICRAEVEQLLQAELPIHVLGGGHCNELWTEVTPSGQTVALIGGSQLASFAAVQLEFDVDQDRLLSVDVQEVVNENGTTDTSLAELIATWRVRADAELNTEIGYLAQPVAQRSREMQDLITYSWLWAYPAVDFAVTNLGGMRTQLPAGPLTQGEIVGMMPFDNVLVQVELTGSEFAQLFGVRIDAAVAGAQRSGLRWIDGRTGEPLESDRTYRVLINDFMYAGGDNYQVASYDDAGYDTGIDWRQPVLSWIEAQATSVEKPLNPLITVMRSK